MGRPKPGPCTHCGGEITGGASHGLCKSCYMYQRRIGADRPIGPPCALCNERTSNDPRKRRRGYCTRCYSRLRRKGLLPLVRAAVPYLRPCTHCGLPTLIPLRGWCGTCYRRWQRTGSLELTQTYILNCQHCGARRRRKSRPSGGYEGGRGMCGACYQYLMKFGKLRPPAVLKTYQYQPRGA